MKHLYSCWSFASAKICQNFTFVEDFAGSSSFFFSSRAIAWPKARSASLNGAAACLTVSNAAKISSPSILLGSPPSLPPRERARRGVGRDDPAGAPAGPPVCPPTAGPAGGPAAGPADGSTVGPAVGPAVGSTAGPAAGPAAGAGVTGLAGGVDGAGNSVEDGAAEPPSDSISSGKLVLSCKQTMNDGKI